MNLQIKLNYNTKKTVYQQIADQIAEKIYTGELPAEEKLPTFRDLSKELEVSLGTVKHAYDVLMQMNLVSMTQGRGTYVLDINADSTGKKDKAITSIEKMINELKSLNFSPNEIRIFFDLKMREYEDEQPYVKVGIIDCSPEASSFIEEQISDINGTYICEYLLEDVMRNPQMVRDDLNLLITTSTHYGDLNDTLAENDKLMQLALNVSAETVFSLAKIDKNSRVGIVAYSPVFSRVIRREVAKFCELASPPQIYILNGTDGVAAFVKDVDMIICPSNIYKYTKNGELDILNSFLNSEKSVNFLYEIDRGSLIYVKDRIDNILSYLSRG